MKNSKCKICRRLGVSVCGKEKCALKKRSSPPGEKRKKRRGGGLSEYGKELREKQKLKNLYNLRETQFKRIVKEILGFRQKTNQSVSQLLLQVLESRLDNVVFRMGFGSSRAQARQLVSHGHFMVNGKSIDVPSYRVTEGDVISVKQNSAKKNFFQNLLPKLQKHQTPPWLNLDAKNFEAKVVAKPVLEETDLPVEIPIIFEYYSR